VTGPVQVLWIPGPLPGFNEMLDAHGAGGGGRGNHYAHMKRKWTDDIALLAKIHKLRPVACVRLRFVWREPRRRRDPDNVAAGKKLILDGLVRAGVLANDGWDEVAGFTDAWEVSSTPGVLVVLEPAVSNIAVGSGPSSARARKGVLVPHGNSEQGPGEEDDRPRPDNGAGGGPAGAGDGSDDPEVDR
jgi:hypothetical protein